MFPAAFFVKFGLRDIEGFLVIFVVLIFGMGSFIEDVTKKSTEKNLKTARSSWLTQSAFGAILLVYAFLIWFSFLGGWRVFR